jgi:prepilin-type N-terminal cleavage/methylation domain-containing protein
MGGTVKCEQRLEGRIDPAHLEHGFSLIETMMALTILLVVAVGLLPLGVIATTTTENQGHLTARTTEYAQDKLEQLLALAYGDTTSDTRVFPATDVNGSGLTVGGSADPTAPVDLYVDFLDPDGTLLPSVGGVPPARWFYMRVWSVTNPSLNLKQVTVTAVVRSALGGVGIVPQSTVTALKTFPF